MANYFKYYTRKKVLRNQFLLLSVKESMCQYKHKHTFWENFSEIYMESWWGNYFLISVIPGFHHSRVSRASFFFFFFFHFLISVSFYFSFSINLSMFSFFFFVLISFLSGYLFWLVWSTYLKCYNGNYVLLNSSTIYILPEVSPSTESWVPPYQCLSHPIFVILIMSSWYFNSK